MDSSFVNKTDAEVTEIFGQIFDHYVPPELNADERKAAVAELASLYMTTPVTLDERQNSDFRRRGLNISGTVYRTTCEIIEKMQAYDLQVDDPRIWWHTARLRQESEDRLRAQLQDDMERREREFSERAAAAWTAIEARWDDLEAQESEIADLDARERDVERREVTVARRENRRTIILEEMQEGGMLGTSPMKSLYRAKLELEAVERHWDPEACMALVAREDKERVFNIVTYPVRGALAIFMPDG